MNTRRSRLLKIVAFLGISAVILGAVAQGIQVMVTASRTAVHLPSTASPTAKAYRQEWDALIAWKWEMYRRHVKPRVNTFLPADRELPDLPVLPK
jgi:hypothetical protein